MKVFGEARVVVVVGRYVGGGGSRVALGQDQPHTKQQGLHFVLQSFGLSTGCVGHLAWVQTSELNCCLLKEAKTRSLRSLNSAG